MYEPNKWLVLALGSAGLFVCTTQITAVLVSLPSTIEELNGTVLSTLESLLATHVTVKLYASVLYNSILP